MVQYRVPVLEKFGWQEPILSQLNDPPGVPTKGDRYIVGTGTGAWATHDTEFTWYDGAAWKFDIPADGWISYDKNLNYLVVFDGAAWGALTSDGSLTLTGDVNSTGFALDWDLIDNNPSAISFDSAGLPGILEIDTTNAAEQVKMSGNLDVAGNILLQGDLNLTTVATDFDLIDNTSNALSFDTAGKAGILAIDTVNGSEGVSMSGDLNVSGNLTVSGTTTSIDTTNTTILDKLITLNKGGLATSGGGTGWEIEEGNAYEVTDLTTVADVAGSLDGTYFIMSDNAGTVGVWIDVDNSGTVEPVHGASRSIEVTTITTGMVANDVATQIQLAIDADAQFGATVSTNVVTVTDASFGIRTDATAGTSGFTPSVTTQGAAGVASGYVKVSAARTGFDIQAPANSNVVTIVPGATASLAIQGNLTVESASFINQDCTTDASPTFAAVQLTDVGGTNDLVIDSGETNTADRTLSINVNDANRTFDMSQNLTIGGAAGGTLAFSTASTMTVESASIINQDVTTDASPTFAAVQLTDVGGTNDLILDSGETNTADRTLSLNVNDADRTLDISQNFTIGGTQAGTLAYTSASTLTVAGASAIDQDVQVAATPSFAGVKLADTNSTNFLTVDWNEDDTVDRSLNFAVNGGNRAVSLSQDFSVGGTAAGSVNFTAATNITIAGLSAINQDVQTTAAPSFAGLTLTGNVDMTAAARTVNVVDNTVSAVAFDTVGLPGILAIDSTTGTEKVTMSGDLVVSGSQTLTGNLTDGSVSLSVVQAEQAYTRRAQYDAQLDVIFFDIV